VNAHVIPSGTDHFDRARAEGPALILDAPTRITRASSIAHTMASTPAANIAGIPRRMCEFRKF